MKASLLPPTDRRGVALTVIAFVVVLLAGGALFNAIVGGILRSRHPVPGAFYQVAGHPMHLYCTGTGFANGGARRRPRRRLALLAEGAAGARADRARVLVRSSGDRLERAPARTP